MNRPFIKLIKCDRSYFFYDVNANKIVKISSQSYDILNGLLSNPTKDYSNKLNDECAQYYKKGFLQSNQIRIVNRGLRTDELMHLLNSELHSLLLQVTRDCNLNCKYCFYSGKYDGIRTHEKEYMNSYLSKKIIDFFFQRTQPNQVQNVGFYGGEPLLNFELIYDVVKYIDKTYTGKKICYSITTNGLLLSPEVWRFLNDYSFFTTISIDGPQEIHDTNRVFSDGRGSFDIINKNIKYGFEYYPEYYKSNVRFNTVITKDKHKVERFFRETPIFQIVTSKLSDINKYHMSSIDIEPYEHSASDRIEQNGAHKMRMLVNILKSDKKDYGQYGLRINEILNKLKETQKYPLTNAVSAGLCMPGVSRLFATVNGDFYMCEKVNDNSEELKLGNVLSGWNETNIMKLANISNESSEYGCRNCWAINLCNMCAAKISALGPQRLNQKCNEVRRRIEADLKDICILYEVRGEL